MSGPLVRVRNLVHAYAREPVLRVDELELGPGRWHLSGPNGAGKTTLLRILASLLRATRGHVEVAGHRLPGEARQARARVGFAGHEPSLHANLSVAQALTLHARLHDVDLARVDESLSAWGLEAMRRERVDALSFGQRRRLDLARCLLHAPDVVLLDEPTSGLDAAARTMLQERLEAAAPRLVLLAAPHEPGLATEARLRLEDGQIEEVAP